MINYADKMEMESRLMGNIADWMEKHGRVLSERLHRRPDQRDPLEGTEFPNCRCGRHDMLDSAAVKYTVYEANLCRIYASEMSG